MAIFKNMSITSKGMALYAKAQAGQEIHFTKMQVGSGQIETQNPVTLLGLLDPKLDVCIVSITANPELKNANLIGKVTNKNVKEAIYICELGLFAKDPDEGEILYGYVSAGQYGDYYAPESQGPYSWEYEINAAIGNAANVTAEFSRSDWDYAIVSSNKNFLHLEGGNQREINRSIDNLFQSVKTNLKYTNEQLNETIKNNVIDKGDFNEIKKVGIYAMNNAQYNTPISNQHFYSLIVTKSGLGSNYIQQVAIAENTTDMYIRYLNDMTWSEWDKIALSSQLEKKANKIIKDDTTNKRYEFGIKNGLLYYREVL